ncbi:LysR family transcriptional regulator [Lentibacillus sp. N15]|uniref:LysR family transcriptional regulator n=1 Tax=Lentibacillus songyuanensis TaxID=3136161 RepID=UPI0031BB2539
MDFTELKYVLAVSKHQSITKAATSLFISQPSLSRYLKNLETRLGLKLFEKIGNKFVLTYAGEVYVNTSYRILSLKKQLDQQLSDIKNDKKGRIHLALSRIRGSHVLPNVLPEFTKEYPEFNIEVTEAQSTEIEDKIIRGEVDVAIMNRPIKNPNIDHWLIQKEYLLLAVPPSHPKSKYKKKFKGLPYYWIDLSIFENELFVLTDSSQRTRELANQALKKYNVNPNVALTTQNLETAIKLAANSIGVSFTPESFTKFIHTPVAPHYFIIGEPPITTDLVAAFRKGTYLSNATKRFIEIYKSRI